MNRLRYTLFITCFWLLISCDSNQTDTFQSHVVEEVAYTSDEEMQSLFDSHAQDEQVLIKGIVVKNLSDDNEGSRHQKFILKLESGQTVLVSHNIDLADRITLLEEGDDIKVYGQYEWNSKGGVVHWTHHDPQGRHIGGWIEHEGRLYE